MMRREHHLAGQPGDPGQQRGDSDDGGAAEETAVHGRPRRGWGLHGAAMVQTEAAGRRADSGRDWDRIVPFPLPRGRPASAEFALFFGVPPPVANIKSAEKRARQTVKRRARNVAARSKLRTAIKGVVNAVNAGNKDEAAAKLKEAGPIIDSAVNKGVIHRNKASRHKSHLNARIKEMSAG